MTETVGHGTSGGSEVMVEFVIIGPVKKLASVLAALLAVSFSACNTGSAPPKIGTVAPDFTVQDVDRKVSLSGLRGKIVVLNFWASWCPPCVSETPSLVAMSRRMRDHNVVVLAVSVDDDDSAYHKFIKEQGMDMLTVRDADKKSNDLYGTHVFPETYIIDRNGVLRRKVIGEMDWTTREMTEYLTKL
jgi:peroxiredoxin